MTQLAHHGWPTKVPKSRAVNVLGQYVILTEDVFEETLGSRWHETSYANRWLHKMNFSGDGFMLESLEGPEKGLLHPGLTRGAIEELLLARNYLASINALNHKGSRGAPEFQNLRILDASRNQLRVCELHLPSLIELNLSHNYLRRFPNPAGTPRLVRFSVSHNEIDDSIRPYGKTLRLRSFDVSHNKISWKPSEFAGNIGAFAEHPALVELSMWPNPFAYFFQEYQLLTLDRIQKLVRLDGYNIDSHIRADVLEMSLDVLQVDYSKLDITVAAKELENKVAKPHAEGIPTVVPSFHMMNAALGKALESQDTALEGMDAFACLVHDLGNSPAIHRARLMYIQDKSDVVEEGEARLRPMTHAEELQETLEFRDSVQQIMERYDGEQPRMIECLISLVKGGCLEHRRLTRTCIQLVADYLDTKAETEELTPKAANTIFQGILLLAAPGMLGVCEKPRVCREATKRPYNLGTPPLCEQVKYWGTRTQIATAAALTQALAGVAQPSLSERKVSPARALVMGAALPLLCREASEDRGLDQPFNTWGVYEDCDAAPLPDAIESDCIHVKNLPEVRSRVARLGFGGYVVEDTEDENMKQVYFKKEPPEYIHATRRRYTGRTLYIRPCAIDKKAAEEEREMEAWPLWTTSVDLLHIATCDTSHAAAAVTSYGMHKTVANLFLQEDGFVESWVARPSQDDSVRSAFIRICHIALNLLEAEKPASHIALKYFTEQRLHVEVWARLKKRMTLFSQTENDPSLNCVILALVEVIVTMGIYEQAGSPVMLSLKEAGLQPFSDLVSVAGRMQGQDPVIFCAALELIACFLESSSTRDIVIEEVAFKLKASSVLVPFLQSMYVDGAANVKLLQMWRACVETYGEADKSEDATRDWARDAPRISELEDPTMIRIIVDILKLFELYCRHAKTDPTGSMLAMTEMLDSRGRENILLNPDFGLINCRDLTVKRSCLAVLGHVVANSPDQINLIEIGWIMQYVSPQSLHLPARLRFETEVVHFIRTLMQSQSALGEGFRRNLTKGAILSTFEVIMRAAKDMTRNADLKLGLCKAIARLLNTVSSEVMPTDLRNFMGKLDLQKKYIRLLQMQDKNGDHHCCEDLLVTWHLRDVDDMLAPLVWGDLLKTRGTTNYFCTVRLADIVCGQPDVNEETLEVHPLSDEALWWHGHSHLVKTMRRHTPDLSKSWMESQERFLGAGGVDSIMEACDDYFRASGGATGGGKVATLGKNYVEAVEYFQGQLTIVHQRLSEFGDGPAEEEIQDEIQEEEQEPQLESIDDSQEVLAMVTKHLEERLANLNATAVYIFQTNLKQPSKVNRSSLESLAKVFGKYLCQNREMMTSLYAMYPSAWRELVSIPDLYYHSAELRTLEEVLDSAAVYRYPRQPASDPDEVYELLCKAHRELKLILTEHGVQSSREAWISRVDGSSEPMTSGMAEFISDYGGHVYDPGVRKPHEIRREMRFKRWEDASSMLDVSQIVIEYKDAYSLCKACGLLRKFGKLTIIEFRNRYDEPDELGDLALHAHVQLPEGQICRLKLVANNQKMSWLSRQQKLLNEVTHTLNSELEDVGGDLTEEMAAWLAWRVSDTTLHSGDLVSLTNEEAIMAVQGSNVIGSDSCSPLQSRFVFVVLDPPEVRRKGVILSTGQGTLKTMTAHGRLRAGEMTFISSDMTQSWISSKISGTVTCSVRDLAHTEEIVGFNLSNADPRYSRSKHVLTEDMDCIKTMDFITIRVVASGKYLTMMRSPQSLGVFASDDTASVRAMVARAQVEAWQNFQVVRVGSLLRLFKNPGDESALELMMERTKPSVEEILYEMLVRAYMHKSAFTHRSHHNVAPTPGFDVVCRRLTDRFDWDPEHPPAKRRRYRRFVAAVLRTFYALLALPADVEYRETVLDVLWGNLEAGTMALPQFVAMVLAAQQMPRGGLNTCDAWLAAKLLRLLAAMLTVVPPAFVSRKWGTADSARENDFAAFQIYGKKAKSFLHYNHQRIMTWDVCAAYMRTISAQSLEQRLFTAHEQKLSQQEVVLLREFARALCGLVRCYTGSSFQPVPLASQTSAGIRKHFEDALKWRAKFFDGSLGGAARSVLIQAYLYGANWEALAYQSLGFNSQVRQNVRLVSSLVNWSTFALAGVMAQCSACPETDFQYEVCEAISAASVNGIQIVPRTRVNELMRERAIDSLRVKVDQVIYCGAMDEYFRELQWSNRLGGLKKSRTSDVRRPGYLEVAYNEKNAQRCETLAFCWVGSPGSADLVRRVVATTSGHFFVVCKLPSGVAEQDITPEQIQVETIRPLDTLGRMVVCPRTRQLLGLWWGSPHYKPKTPGDESDPLLPKRQILIFETSIRRRFFLQAVQSVTRTRALLGESVPGYHLTDEMYNRISVSASHDRLRRNGLLASFFIKPSSPTTGPPDFLVLTTHSVGFFAVQDLTQIFSGDLGEDPFYNMHLDYVDKKGHLFDAESDSDSDEVPACVDKAPVPNALPKQRDGPFPLLGLKGVWFPKEEEPAVRLKFNQEISVDFYSEVDRQRFREFLAHALMNLPTDAMEESWNMVPSNHDDLQKVVKKVEERAQTTDYTGVGIVVTREV